MIAMLRTPVKQKEQKGSTFDFKNDNKDENYDRRKTYCQTNFNTQKWRSDQEAINNNTNESRSIRQDKEMDDSKLSKSTILPLSIKEGSTPLPSQDIIKMMNNQIDGVRKELMTAIEKLSTKIDSRDRGSKINIDTVDQISNPWDQQAFKTEPTRKGTVINSMINTQSEYDIKNENYSSNQYMTSREGTRHKKSKIYFRYPD